MSGFNGSYQGLLDLTLIYGEPGGLGREADYPGVVVELSRADVPGSILVELPKSLHLDLFKGPSRARLTLPDGRTFAGRVTEIRRGRDTFVLVPEA